MVYGFKLTKEKDTYFLNIPECGYSTNTSSFSGVRYSKQSRKIKVDVDQLRNKSYISIYWSSPDGSLSEIQKSYNEFILRYLYPWAGYNKDKPYKPADSSQLNVKFNDNFYNLYKFLPELDGLEFKLYFIDEFVSFNNLQNTLDEHFYNLLLNARGDARFWYPVTEECDKVLLPRLQHTDFNDVERETKFIFDQDCTVLDPTVYKHNRQTQENYMSWDNQWQVRLRFYESNLCYNL